VSSAQSGYLIAFSQNRPPMDVLRFLGPYDAISLEALLVVLVLFFVFPFPEGRETFDLRRSFYFPTSNTPTQLLAFGLGRGRPAPYPPVLRLRDLRPISRKEVSAYSGAS